MTTALVGFASGQTVPAGSLVRLTWVLPGLQLDPLQLFPKHLAALWQTMPTTTHLFPANGPNVYPSAKSATFDARTQVARTGAALVADLEALNDSAVELARVELLTPVQVQQSTTQQGALDRDAAAKQAAADAAAHSWWQKVANGLAIGADTLKWVAIAVALVLLLLLYAKAKK